MIRRCVGCADDPPEELNHALRWRRLHPRTQPDFAQTLTHATQTISLAARWRRRDNEGDDRGGSAHNHPPFVHPQVPEPVFKARLAVPVVQSHTKP